MALLSAYTTACVSGPSTTRFSMARVVKAIEDRQAEGYSFSASRD